MTIEQILEKIGVTELPMYPGGFATMWETVFADIGVAPLAIMNVVRLQRMEWD